MITLNCQICDKPFQVKPYRKDKAQFCGYVCMGKARFAENPLPPNPFPKGNKIRKGHKPTNAFEKGHTPWNKELKGIHLSPETEFKKGVNMRGYQIGDERVRLDTNGKPRTWVKIGLPNIWKLRCVLTWEKHHGEVPKNKLIHHKDRDSLNDDISNLEALTRSEHIKEHKNDFEENRLASLRKK